MLKAVLFDLDGTLIDFMRMKCEAVSAAVDSMVSSGLKLGRQEAEQRLMKIYWEVGIEHPLIFQKFFQKVMGRVDYRLLAKAVIAYRKRKADFAKPLPGAVRVLKQLKRRRLRIGIVTDAPAVNAWIRLVQMGLEDMFDVVVTLDDTGKLKPSRKPFDIALKNLGMNGREVLFVGDLPERDVLGARKAGMKTAFARYGNLGFSGNSGADWELNDIKDLLRIVK